MPPGPVPTPARRAAERVAGRAAERIQTLGEEIANAVTHGLGFVASLAVAPFLVSAAVQGGGGLRLTAALLFAATLVLLYGASTVYHALPRAMPRAKGWLQRIDHAAIYLLIAGTYAPVLLVGLRGAWGWTLFGIVWTLAVAGVTLKCVFGTDRYVRLSTAGYLGMGWLAVVAIRPLLANLSPGALVWLGVGGLAYTVGVVFFVWERQRYAHALWHVFVLGGSAAHAWAVLAYVLPASAA